MNDFEVWQQAVDKIDMTEAALPVVRGQTLLEDSQVEMYNKIQKLLNADGMESCHRFLYNLDPLELSEAECMKINNLYKLGQDRGFIAVEAEEGADEETAEKTDECDLAAASAPVQPSTVPAAPQAPASAFTVVYSAMRDGEIKTGEAYSNSYNTRSAKMDILNKLERAGYSNIQILAIEAGDPDACDCCKSETPDTALPDYANEADDREPLSHALDAQGIKTSTANLAGQDTVAMTKLSDSDETEDDVKEDDMLKGREHNLHVDEADDKEADDKSEDKADDKAEDKETDKAEDKKEDTKKEEKSEEPDEKMKDDADEKADKADDKDDKELSDAEKESLKDAYKKAFKAAMEKNKFETSFSELSLEQKVKFFETLQKAWGDKADPAEFMTDKETQQLEKIVVKK